MRLAVRTVDGDRVDTIAVDGQAVSFATGRARDIVESCARTRHISPADAVVGFLRGWSNGYLTIQELRPSKALRSKHLSGQHNQQDHGNRVSSPNALPGIDVLDGEEYDSLHGDAWDDAGIDLGSDGEEMGLTARFFTNGDMHVVLDLEDGKRQVLEEMNPESMRQLAYDITEMIDADSSDDDFHDIVADIDSDRHDFYIGAYGSGDIRFKPPGTEEWLDLSSEDMAAFAEHLLDIADSYEEHDFDDTAKSGRQPHQRKHLPGEHDQDDHGNRGGADIGGLDKLKLGKRVALQPGEKLVSSRKFGSSDASSWRLLAAEVDTPAGRQIRLGVVEPDSARHWTAGPNPAVQGQIAAIDAEMAALDELGDATWTDEQGARWEELADAKSELESESDSLGMNRTATLTPDGVGQLRVGLEEAARRGKEHTKAFNAWWDGPEGARLEELHDLRESTLGPNSYKLPDSNPAKAAWNAEHGEEMQRLEALSPDPYSILIEGVVPSPDGHDLVWSAEGSDDGEGGWAVKLGVQPTDPELADGWYPGAYDDAARFEPKDLKDLLAGLGELAGNTAKSARGRTIKHSQSGVAMQLKSFQPQVKSVSDNGQVGTATIAIATLNVVDKDGDVTLPGFFGEQHAQMVPVHDWNHVPIGKGRVYEKGNQALVDVKFNLNIPEAKNWYEAIKFDMENPPSLQEYSYGYHVLDGGSRKGTFGTQSVRYLTPRPDGSAGGKVFEFSPVLLGAGEGTGTVDVKSRARERLAARRAGAQAIGSPFGGGVAPHETGTVARSWDGAKTAAAIPDGALPSQLRTVYAWADPNGDLEKKDSYRFPHHHGIGGPANIRACLAGIAVLNGATGDSGLSEADRKSVYDHLAAHLKDADREPPQLLTATSGASKNLRFGDEAANVLAAVAGLTDRATDVMAIRRTKGKGMAPATADLLSWVSDELIRLKSLLEHPIEAETPQPDDSEVAAVLMAATAAIHGI